MTMQQPHGQWRHLLNKIKHYPSSWVKSQRAQDQVFHTFETIANYHISKLKTYNPSTRKIDSLMLTAHWAEIKLDIW